MNILRTMSLTVMMLALAGGLSPLANAQQTDSSPPVNSSPPAAPMTPEADGQSDRTMNWLPPGSLVQVKESQGIRYVSGGVGESERAELRALSDRFNLRLMFAMQDSGKYLADVRVNIMDQSGRPVLDAEAQGPWFFAQLPPGSYQVRVSTRNETQQQTVSVGDSQRAWLSFYW